MSTNSRRASAAADGLCINLLLKGDSRPAVRRVRDEENLNSIHESVTRLHLRPRRARRTRGAARSAATRDDAAASLWHSLVVLVYTYWKCKYNNNNGKLG